MPANVKVTKDRTPQVIAALQELGRTRIMVGIPEEKDPRDEGQGIGNAAIGYLAENGSPANNVPARPWLVPGIEKAQPQIIAGLQNAGKAALDGNAARADQLMNAVGLAARNSVVEYINTNIPPPLSPKTVAARRTGYGRRRKMAKKRGISIMSLAREEIALGEHGAAGGVIALVASGQFRAAITWVLRKI